MVTDTTQPTLQHFLTTATTGPFVAIYLNREAVIDRDQLRLQLRHLIDHAEAVMAETWPDADWSPYASQLTSLAQDPTELMALTGTALGVLTNGEQRYWQGLEYPVVDTAMVTATPQLLPLILDAQNRLEFDLLTLNADSIALYRNQGDELVPLHLPAGAPVTLEQALGSELRGGSVNTVGQGAGRVSYHGHGDQSSEAEIDQRRYYQAVDDYVTTHFSNLADRRLVLFGLPQNIALFREVSRNPHLSGSMQVEMSPSNLTLAELDAAIDVLREHNGTNVRNRILATIDWAKSGGRYLDDLGAIISASQSGAVERLVIRNGARINGCLQSDGTVDTDSAQAKHNNLLTDLADATLARGGKVRVLEADSLAGPVVAVLRYRVAE